MHDLGEGTSARPVRHRLQQSADVVEEWGGRLGAAVVVAVSPGEEEPSPRQRQAGVEQVALLGLVGVARLEAE